LAEHWDGTSWTRVASPSPDRDLVQNDLVGVGVDPASSSDVWAVGDEGETFEADDQPLAATLQGGSFVRTDIQHLPYSSQGNGLAGVAVIGHDDVWAAGTQGPPGFRDGPATPLILRWRGTAWHRQTQPLPRAALLAVAADRSSGTVWFGGYRSGSGLDEHPVVEAVCPS
jgi:hypothetical protein